LISYFFSLSLSYFFLFLFFFYCLTHQIEQYFFGQVTVSLFPFISFSFRLASLKWLIRYVVFCFGCWKRLISLCSVIILDLSRLCFLRRLWFACLLVGLLFFFKFYVAPTGIVSVVNFFKWNVSLIRRSSSVNTDSRWNAASMETRRCRRYVHICHQAERISALGRQ
jgi:hypothetical protein